MSANSPFYHLIAANTEPTDDVRRKIESYLAPTLAKVDTIDQAIDSAQASLEALQAKRERKLKHIQAHRALYSPIRRVPDDVLENIFFETLPIRRNATMGTWDSPLKLGRVCSAWRTVAYSSSSLWTMIHIAIPSIGIPGAEPGPISHEYEWQMEIRLAMNLKCAIEEWLLRANGRPLSVSVGSQLREDVAEEAVYEVVSAIVPFANQLRQLDLQFPMTPDILGLLGQLDNMPETPKLHSLRLQDTKPYSLLGTHSPRQPFFAKLLPFNVSELRHFHAFYLDLTHHHQLPVRWLGLTELSLVRCKIDQSEIIAILRLATQLVKFTLDFTRKYPQGSAQPGEPPIHLPRLKEFSIHEHVRFAASFRVPNLRHLRFEGVILGPGAHNTLARFDIIDLLSHQTLLTTLQINLASLNLATLLQVLSLVPSLRTLTFEKRSDHQMINFFGQYPHPQMQLTDEIIDSLTPVETGDGTLVAKICPLLEIFECNASADFSDEALEQFIRRRTAHNFTGSTLGAIFVHFTRPPTVDLSEILNTAIQEGLHLELYYSEPDTSKPGPERLYSPWPGTRVLEEVPKWAYHLCG